MKFENVEQVAAWSLTEEGQQFTKDVAEQYEDAKRLLDAIAVLVIIEHAILANFVTIHDDPNGSDPQAFALLTVNERFREYQRLKAWQRYRETGLVPISQDT